MLRGRNCQALHRYCFKAITVCSMTEDIYSMGSFPQSPPLEPMWPTKMWNTPQAQAPLNCIGFRAIRQYKYIPTLPSMVQVENWSTPLCPLQWDHIFLCIPLSSQSAELNQQVRQKKSESKNQNISTSGPQKLVM